MPKIFRDPLHSLVRSLTKAEKRNFRLYAKRLQSKQDMLFVRLFDILDKAITYDDQLIKEKLKLTGSNLSNLKRHLYAQILKSLRLLHIEKDREIQIREQIDHAKILYEKGLYLQSLKLLDRVRAIAANAHQEVLVLEIIEIQKYIEERHITRSRKEKGKMEALLNAAEQQEQLISNMVRLSNLKIEVHGLYITMGHARNEKDHQQVTEKFLATLQEFEAKKLGFMEQVFLHQSYMWYYYILLDFEKCHHHAHRWVAIFDRHPDMIKDDPVLYMRGLAYELTTLFSLRHREAYDKTMEKFEHFSKEYDSHMNMTGRIINFLYLYTARLNKHFLAGTYAEGIKLVPQIERGIKRYEPFIDIHRIMVFNYKMAWLFFGAGNYSKSIDYLNAIINLEAGHLREDIQCYSRLLHLIAHYELGNHEYLRYQVETVARFFEKMKDLNHIQREILGFFRKNSALRGAGLQLALQHLREKVIILSNDPYERRAFQHLDVLEWIDKKLSILNKTTRNK
ncbi:MAG TPA: hypothetical protein VI603_19060 [Saprospiraceae bacterium]|nr:hypothetical protein [Saprospiraceae bacterium]